MVDDGTRGPPHGSTPGPTAPKVQADAARSMERTPPDARPAPAADGVLVAGDTTYRGAFAIVSASGEVSGTGAVEWANGERFTGTLVKGRRQGKGRFSWASGQWYEGDWVDDRATGHGVSQFVDLLSLLRARIEQQQWDYCYLDGGCSAKSRQESILRFRHEAVPLFLISLKAGGTGLNLTQADTVLHLDPWWNPAVEDQASDRAHRMGQTQPVTVYRLVCEQTVEEKIVALHDEKRALADGLLPRL